MRKVKWDVERRKKMVGYVRRREESESDVDVGVPVVLVRLYRVLASLILELHWRRGDVGGRAQPLEEKVKMVLESREKFLGWVTRGWESESGVGVGVTLEVGLHRFKKS